jgi:hypothetical protein
VAGLVVRGALAVGAAQHDLALRTKHDFFEGLGEVLGRHLLVSAARGVQRRLVDEVGEVGADHARRGPGDALQVDGWRQRDVASVDLEDLSSALAVG